VSKPKVLITTNPLDHEGGVVNYFRVFLTNFKSEEVDLVHISFGSRMKHFYSPWKKLVLYPIYFLGDYLQFIYILLTDRCVRVIQVNPSLIPVPLIRDAFVLLGAKLLRRRVVVFYRGWKENVVRTLISNSLIRGLFRLVYGRADVTLVLASQFRDDLIEIGLAPSSIQVTTTMYDACEILPLTDRSGLRPKLLFLGRISQLKGVDEFIDAAAILAERDIDFECVFVGHGDKGGVVEAYQARVQSLGLDNRIEFLGRLTGRRKFETYSNSDIYVLPSWTEGCPNSVLEALGSGLFVVSTNVGALRDVIENEVNGKIVPRKDSDKLADALTWACESIEDIRSRRPAIQEDAVKRYEANIIFDDMGELYENLIND